MSRRKRDDAKTHNHCSRDASNCPVAVRNIQARYFIATTHDATSLLFSTPTICTGELFRVSS